MIWLSLDFINDNVRSPENTVCVEIRTFEYENSQNCSVVFSAFPALDSV